MKRNFAAGTVAGMALALGFGAMPAVAFPGTISGTVTAESATAGSPATKNPAVGVAASTVPAVPSAGTLPSAGPSGAGLSEAVLRDLGMSLAEFNAAGELGRRAADAMNSLRVLPGFVGISLKGGRILVQGSGTALHARVDELNKPGPANFVLVPPSAMAPSTPVPTPVPTAASPAPGPAQSAPAPELIAGTIDQLFQAYVREVGTRGLQAVAYTGGHFVIRTGSVNTSESDASASVVAPSAQASASALTPSVQASGGKLTPAQFVARYANVKLEKGAAVKTEGDIFGGQGYFVDNMARCSTGFSGFGPTGLPLVLTAGHCAEDGLAKAAGVEPLSWAPAGGAPTRTPWPVPPLAPLGSFGFSQFGGPNNSAAAADGSIVGTDIAVIKDISAGLNLQPAASTWGNASAPDPVKIVGTAAPLQGEPVCRSGRTSGWKCGTIDSVGIWMMPGSKSVPPNYDNDLRPVRAFDSTSVKSAGGDSGGPWISGNYAVGTHTGAESLNGVQIRAIAATLRDAVTSIPGGAQLQLFLNKPELAVPASPTFRAGASVTGRVPAAPASAVAANSQVRVTVPGQQPLEVPVDAAGNWKFPAPKTPGTFTFSAETVNGFSRSGAVTFTAVVAPSSLTTPGITTPATAPLTELKSVAGTGTPGATVTLSGDAAGSGLVGPDGLWSVRLAGPAVFGKVKVSAVLSYPGLPDSTAATGIFTVTPPAPALASLSDGQHLTAGAFPRTIEGSGLNGAEIEVAIDGVPLSPPPAGGAGAGSRSVAGILAPLVLVTAGGQWSVVFPATLGLGAHRLSVTQAVDGVISAQASATFTIDAPAEVPAANVTVSPPGDTAVVVRAMAPALANTGASGLFLAGGLAGGALVLGAVLLGLGRRRPLRSSRR